MYKEDSVYSQMGGISSYSYNGPCPIWGDTANGKGVIGSSDDGQGVWAWTSTGTALVAIADAGGDAAVFNGDVQVVGDFVCAKLAKMSGTFRIDHPLDPANKYLSHSFVESPEMKNVYDGLVVLDHAGEVVVELPAWFEALNENFRYQLTPVGAPAPRLHIAKKIAGNFFKIAGGEPGMEVCWQVTGNRHDAYARAHPIVVEEDKAEAERGLYLAPEEHGQPSEKGIHRAKLPTPDAVNGQGELAEEELSEVAAGIIFVGGVPQEPIKPPRF
jgi:hypothetical protein